MLCKLFAFKPLEPPLASSENMDFCESLYIQIGTSKVSITTDDVFNKHLEQTSKFPNKITKISSEMSDMNDDINFANLSLTESDREFHSVIGHIEDMLMEEKFLELHKQFMEKYWREFEDTEENKFVYTDIFKEYQATIEKYIETELTNKVNNFSMKNFEEEIKSRQNELVGEIFELLSSFSDFLEFKQKFLDYKAMKEGQMIDFSKDICVSKCLIINDD